LILDIDKPKNASSTITSPVSDHLGSHNVHKTSKTFKNTSIGQISTSFNHNDLIDGPYKDVLNKSKMHY